MSKPFDSEAFKNEKKVLTRDVGNVTLPELKQLPTQEEVDSLKAQVNCLREALLMIAMPTDGDQTTTNHHIAIDALATTSGQCLAEVKAKAIEEAMPKIINACVKYAVEKYIDTSVEMVSIGQLKHLSEIRHHGEWAK